MTHTERLFKRSAAGTILFWYGTVEQWSTQNGIAYKLAYHHGTLGGIAQTSYSDVIYPKSKKTSLEQAEFELNSIYERKKKLGYKTISQIVSTTSSNTLIHWETRDLNDVELKNVLNINLPKYNTDANNCIKPMKCQKFQIGKMQYPCLIQPKINGVRAVIMLEEKEPEGLFDYDIVTIDNVNYKVVIKTKEGLQYKISHIEDVFRRLYNEFPKYKNIVFDGEIYIKDAKVTTIGGAARNIQNEYHHALQFVNFDLSISDLNNQERIVLMDKIWSDYISTTNEYTHKDVFVSICNASHNVWHGFNVIVLHTDECHNDNHALQYMEDALKEGFEGAVVRDSNADYKFGSRPQTMMKLKKFEDAEFKCVDYKWSGSPDDKVGFSVVLVCQNDINDLTFESTVVGTTEERKQLIDNPPIGKMVTIKFYERTKNGIPFHSNVISIRDYE